MRQAAQSDIAAAFYLGLTAQLVPLTAAKNWADAEIIQGEKAESWLIDLSLSRNVIHALDALRSSASIADPGVARDLLISCVAKELATELWSMHDAFRAVMMIRNSVPHDDQFEIDWATILYSHDSKIQFSDRPNDGEHYWGDASLFRQLLQQYASLETTLPSEFQIDRSAVSRFRLHCFDLGHGI